MTIFAKLLPTLGVLVAAGFFISADMQAESASKEAAAAKPAEATQNESYGDTLVVAKEPVKTKFSHNAHVITAGLSCDTCHPDIFERKRGAAKAKGEYNHAAFDAGKTCGVCHDGSSAFSTKEPASCKTCHGSDMKQPETIVFTKPVKAVIFEHKGHVDMGLDCASCHDKAFEMRTGAAEEHPEKFTMEALYAGKYCGACHNGSDAFASNTRCNTCHIGVKGFDRMFAGAAKPAAEQHKK
jgi:c(7)-type cytochrome triheme protein